MPEVKSRKIVFVKCLINLTGSFDYNFRIGFDVDDMIVSSWTAGSATYGGTDTYIMRLNGVGELFQFRSEDNIAIKNVFQIGKSLDGIQTFCVLNNSGLIETGTNNLEMIFALEFIEFHK